MSNDARLDKIEARIEKLAVRLELAEKRHDVLDNDLRQARDGFADMVQGVHNRVCKLEAANPSQPPTSPPTCRLCSDTKIERVYHVVRGWETRLCPCLAVGDVVSADVVNLLPVGSVAEWFPERYMPWVKVSPYRWEKTEGSDWVEQMSGGGKCWTILRIGHGDEAKHAPKCRGCGADIQVADFHWLADGCKCNSGRGINHGLVPKHVCTCHECDPTDSGGTRPDPRLAKQATDAKDKAEEIAGSAYCAAMGLRNTDGLTSCGWDGVRSVATVLRKHGVGREPTDDRSCPCRYTTPCSERCSCVIATSSSGCSRCCRYGSIEQRTATAKQLAAKIDAKEPTLAEVLAREDMKPLVVLAKMAILVRQSSPYPTTVFDRPVDALPPELRAAVEGVK